MQKRLRGSVKAAVNRFRCHMPRVKQSAKVRTNMTISQNAPKNRCRANCEKAMPTKIAPKSPPVHPGCPFGDRDGHSRGSGQTCCEKTLTPGPATNHTRKAEHNASIHERTI